MTDRSGAPYNTGVKVADPPTAKAVRRLEAALGALKALVVKQQAEITALKARVETLESA